MIPKNITGQDLIKKLEFFGYHMVRQKGSHIRIKTIQNGPHSETIPNHKPLREGTVNKILTNISDHLEISKQELEQKLFKDN